MYSFFAISAPHQGVLAAVVHRTRRIMVVQSFSHPSEWPSTKNLVSTSCYWALENKRGKNERNKLFHETLAFAVEKVDGTNVSKDDEGEMYGRRQVIQTDSYQKTSLHNVKAADIKLVKTKLCEKISLMETLVKNLIVYGELVCTEKYDYPQRKLRGSWLVFGAVVRANHGRDADFILLKLREHGFEVAHEDWGRVRIFANPTFFKLVQECNLETPRVKGEDCSLFDIVQTNHKDMETGKLEGIVITLTIPGRQPLIYKWKGAQEEQPSVERALIKALKDESLDNDTSKLFLLFHSVLFAKNDVNPLVKKRKGKTAHQPQPCSQIITTAILSAMTKYNDATSQEDKGVYKQMILKEVERDFVVEAGRQPHEDEKVLMASTFDDVMLCRKIGALVI